MIINFYFIRHGQSIHNLNKGLLAIYKYSTEYDPMLSQKGITNSISTSEDAELPKMKYIVSSPLLRCIATSYFTFLHRYPRKKIHVEPYLSETDPSGFVMKTNLPLTPAKQNELLKEKIGKDVSSKISRNDISYDKNTLKNSDILRFINYFLHESNFLKKNKMNVAVVTHSHLMKKNFKMKKLPCNNGIIKVTVKTDLKKNTTLEDLKFEKIFRGYIS